MIVVVYVCWYVLDMLGCNIDMALHRLPVLADGDTVTGLLDFEFAAFDWRVMEMVMLPTIFSPSRLLLVFFGNMRCHV